MFRSPHGAAAEAASGTTTAGKPNAMAIAAPMAGHLARWPIGLRGVGEVGETGLGAAYSVRARSASRTHDKKQGGG